MTKQEIQALIEKGIAGQGSAIDVGGVLPAILNGILDLAAKGAEKVEVLEIDKDYTDINYDEDTIEAIATQIGITTDEATKLFKGEYEKIILNDVVLPLSIIDKIGDFVMYGGGDRNTAGIWVTFTKGQTYTAKFTEV